MSLHPEEQVGVGGAATAHCRFSHVHDHLRQFISWYFSFGLDGEHLSPHVPRAGLAEVKFHLDARLQCLHVVEHHWESDETSYNGDGGEDNGTECDWP
jgi:hypothetical protein